MFRGLVLLLVVVLVKGNKHPAMTEIYMILLNSQDNEHENVSTSISRQKMYYTLI